MIWKKRVRKKTKRAHGRPSVLSYIAEATLEEGTDAGGKIMSTCGENKPLQPPREGAPNKTEEGRGGKRLNDDRVRENVRKRTEMRTDT